MASDRGDGSSEEITRQAGQEGQQGSVLVIGTSLLLLGTGALYWRANVPGTAFVGYGVAAFLVVVLVFLSAPVAIRSVGDWVISVAGPLSSKTLADRTKQRWHTWLNDRALFRRITAYSQREIGTLWVPFVFQVVGLAWLVHFSGGVSVSPFSAVPGVFFTIAVTIIKLPGQSGEPNIKVQPRRHPFRWLIAVAMAFGFGLFVWDHVAPYELTKPVNPDATAVMTMIALAVGVVLAMLARLGADAERPQSP